MEKEEFVDKLMDIMIKFFKCKRFGVGRIVLKEQLNVTPFMGVAAIFGAIYVDANYDTMERMHSFGVMYADFYEQRVDEIIDRKGKRILNNIILDLEHLIKMAQI